MLYFSMPPLPPSGHPCSLADSATCSRRTAMRRVAVSTGTGSSCTGGCCSTGSKVPTDRSRHRFLRRRHQGDCAGSSSHTWRVHRHARRLWLQLCMAGSGGRWREVTWSPDALPGRMLPTAHDLPVYGRSFASQSPGSLSRTHGSDSATHSTICFTLMPFLRSLQSPTRCAS